MTKGLSQKMTIFKHILAIFGSFSPQLLLKMSNWLEIFRRGATYRVAQGLYKLSPMNKIWTDAAFPKSIIFLGNLKKVWFLAIL